MPGADGQAHTILLQEDKSPELAALLQELVAERGAADAGDAASWQGTGATLRLLLAFAETADQLRAGTVRLTRPRHRP